MAQTKIIVFAAMGLLASHTAAQNTTQPSMPMPSIVHGQLVNPAPAPAVQPPLPTSLNVAGAAVSPSFVPPGVQVKIPCGPNVQGGKVVCN